MPQFAREFVMPSPETFTMPPAAAFVRKYLAGVSVDPFARNSSLATITNDIDPSTTADSHEDAVDFLNRLAAEGISADLVILDPPYSPTQIARCYEAIGRPVTASDTRNANLYRRVRDAADAVLRPGGVVVSFGWNTVGMGKRRGYELLEVLILTHGGAHNDTLCIAERKPA